MNEVSPEDKEKVRNLVSMGKSIEAIQYIRQKFDISLQEADLIVRAVQTNKPDRPVPTTGSMPDKPKTEWIMYIFPAIGILFLALATIMFFHKRDFLSRAVSVPGKVVDLVSIDDGWAPQIEYEYNGKVYQYTSNISGDSEYEINDPVDVLVDPYHPDRVALDSFLENWMLTLIFAVLGLMFAGIGIPVVILFRTR